jgi:hypothetical protein
MGTFMIDQQLMRHGATLWNTERSFAFLPAVAGAFLEVSASHAQI